MKKIITMACAVVMTLTSSIMAFAADAEPIAAISTAYTFENADRSEASIDTFANPFKNLGLDVATVQYTVTIDATASFLSGYDTVMTFGTSDRGMLYICNELVGMNKGGFVDFWPSGTTGTMTYPGKGETYTVDLVFSSEGVAFYLNGEKQAGSNSPALNADGEIGTLGGTDMLNFLNTEDTLNIGDNNTSFWATQDMVLSNIVFFKGEVTSPYILTGSEAKPARIGEEGETVTQAPETTTVAEQAQTQAPIIIQENNSDMTMIMILVVVIVVVVIGVAAMVILSQKRR